MLLLGLAVAVQAGEWLEDFNQALAKARERKAALCVLVADDSAASKETLRAFESDAVRPLVANLAKVKVPARSKTAELVKAPWAPSVVFFQWSHEPATAAEDREVLRRLREAKISVDFDEVPVGDVVRIVGDLVEVRILIPPGEIEAAPVTIKKSDESVEACLRAIADAASLDTFVQHGAVFEDLKERIRKCATVKRVLRRPRAAATDAEARLRPTGLLEEGP